MIAASTFADKTVALFGLGGSGLVTALSLKAGGADVLAFDDNPDRVIAAQAQDVPTADLRAINWSSIDALVLAPGVPLTHPKPHWAVDLAMAAGVEIIGDIEIFARERRALSPSAQMIAITGTNGKSTTTALIAHILSNAGRDVQLGGNIGRAILSLEPPSPARVHVIECSSYQIDLAPGLNPTAGILLNLSPDHLDRHGTMEHYASIKERLVAGSDCAIVGVDDTLSSMISDRLERNGKPVTRISNRTPLADGYYAEGSAIHAAHSGGNAVFTDLKDIPTLRGRHNAQNAAAAIAACSTAGLTGAKIIDGLRSFPGLSHRMQPVAQRGNTVFVNDSKATNADAAAPALASYERVYWIAGGLAKDGGIAPLSDLFPHIVKAYLIGEAASAFSATLGSSVPYEIAETLDRAVAHAAADAANDNVKASAVLLSPACASFDQFANFELRGDAFVAAVSQLPDIKMLISPDQGVV